MTFGGGFWISAGVLLELVALLWITNPKHERTRALLRAPLVLVLGVLVRAGLID